MWGSLKSLASQISFALLTCLLALFTGLAGCGSGESTSKSTTVAAQTGTPGNHAKANLRPAAGSEAAGTATYAKSPSGYLLKVDVKGLEPTHGQSQYGLWQLESPADRVALKTADDMVALATYRVGNSGRLSVELEPTAKAFTLLEAGHLTHFLITRIDSPDRLEGTILRFDKTGKSPDLGSAITEGVFSGPLVGAAE
jgi:hypothetical protein